MAIIENIKEAVSLARKIDNMDLYRALLDSQGEVVDMMEDLRKKDDKIQQLEKALEIKGKLVINKSAYYLIDDSGNPIDGPFCTKCFDVDHIFCRLVRVRTKQYRFAVQCQRCKEPFEDNTAERFSRNLNHASEIEETGDSPG